VFLATPLFMYVSRPKLSELSKIQQLTASLTERIHDVVYVIPRIPEDTADGGGAGQINLEEYALDIVYYLKRLKENIDKLPDMEIEADVAASLEELRLEEEKIDRELNEAILEAKVVKREYLEHLNLSNIGIYS
jgi:hypothetical protein